MINQSLTALSSLALLCACASAQKPSAAGQMDILSAQDTLEVCLNRTSNAGPAEQQTCIGEYSQACMTLRPDGETTVGMVQCTIEELEAWDVVLNASYIGLRQRHEGMMAADALLDAQRAWITFRDADCLAERAVFEGGTIAQIIHASCQMDHTARRALVLRWRLDDLPN
ncbi:MAG: lysozyme inhibitor LprI family protein [Maricaulis sp.]|uniref:lysozyme inhibitor LprI family protein n=1 Tax=Maricaulis sp. TaxID=1486257 RepID=UPI00260C29BC|nr:lysozyme inhibitor LprI family protein [Maricaulis sp.]MDM7983191.1 lysozyme inhibitor LprI family protein [Maricaulis sp.]